MSRPHQDDLEWFAGQMWDKLLANSHKASFDEVEFSYALMRLKQEVVELNGAVYDIMCEVRPLEEVALEVIGEAADVANFAFMIAYKARNLKTSA